MRTKNLLIFAMVFVMLISVFSIQTFAVGETTTVYVTISNGSLMLSQESITVTDIDNDGVLTINDALYLAHEKKYDGGVAAGYASAKGQYGLALTKLWGVENGGSYGYYVNNVLAMGLTDTVKSGDYINAFVYTDTSMYSDTYCFFDVNNISVNEGKELTLTLSAAGFDKNWAPIVIPVADATILIDGAESSFKTDVNGKVTIKIDNAKHSYIISAKSDDSILVSPVCVASIIETTPQTGDIDLIIYIIIAVAALYSALIIRPRNKNA